jgi:bifunctional NMN adenylyltransferase/nudix hydrolase
MLRTTEEIYEVGGVGVIVGRFQVSELTEGHKSLFDSVIERHNKMICVVGLSRIKASRNNPLDFEARRKMISEEYPDVQVVYINDMSDDKAWSVKLDKIISTHVPPHSEVILYGSRDSFMGHYSGRFKTKELLQESYTSGTEDRENNSFTALNSKDFRRGAIWATQNQYDSCFPTTDIAIVSEFDDGSKKLLLARKPEETKYRFVGGFVDPKGERGEANFLEKNAKREVGEETHVETENYQYIGSFLVDDWRYRGERSKVVTTLFRASYVFGKPEPDDDISELRWFPISEKYSDVSNLMQNIVDEHKPLMEAFIAYEIPETEEIN